MEPKQLVRRYIDALNAQDWDALADRVAEDMVRHSCATPDLTITTRSQFLRFAQENAAVFSDLWHEIEMILAEGDLVACYLRLTGTQTGPIGPFPSLGRRVDMPFVAFLRVSQERVEEMWVEWDNVCFLTQLGHWPGTPS